MKDLKTEINYKFVDWKRAKNKCRVTVNKGTSDLEATEEFKKKLLISEHSPIRVLRIDWSWSDIPYCYSTHYVRHHVGIEKWVSTERTDRTGIDRNTLPQTNPVKLDMESNVQGLINMGRVRLCNQASIETRQYYEDLKVTLHNDEDTKEIANVLVPNCIYRFGCPEKFGDNKCKKFKAFLEYANKKGYTIEDLSDLQTRYDVYNEWFYETHK